MSESLSFHELLVQIRAGNSEAAAELVRRYDSTLRRVVRMRMFDTRMRRVLDSVDICQSVWASFFVRATGGDDLPAEPDHLIHLLAAMARNKLISEARKQQAACRDNRRNLSVESDPGDLVDPAPSPSRQVALQELVGEVQRRLLPDERQLQDLRQQNLSWEEIAARLGGSAVVLRKKWSRALDRVAHELGLDEPDHE